MSNSTHLSIQTEVFEQPNYQPTETKLSEALPSSAFAHFLRSHKKSTIYTAVLLAVLTNAIGLNLLLSKLQF